MLIENLKQTCVACPSQWEFITSLNRPVYVRYRWGYLSVKVGKPNGDLMSAVGGIEIYGEVIDNKGWDGMIGWNEVEERIKDLEI